MPDIPNNDGYLKRVDVALRARFPNLTTRLFEVTPGSYVIHFEAAQQDAAEIAEEFDQRIRYATLSATVTNTLPETFLNELRCISDEDVARDFAGLPFTRFDLYNLLNSRFRAVRILDVQNNGHNRLTALVQGTTSHAERLDILKFLNGLKMPSEWTVETATDPIEAPSYPYDHALQILPTKMTALGRFAIEDERRFFETIGDVPGRRFSCREIAGTEPDETRCLMDCSSGRHMNLRQALILYDEVWCVPPLSENMTAFLAGQALGSADLLTAVESGRLRFVLTYEERSSDLKLLDAAAERRPFAVLGRRMAGALLLSSVADAAADYRLADPALFPALRELCEAVGPALAVKSHDLLRTVLWPQSALRGSVQMIVDRGTKGGPANLLAEQIAARVQANHGADVRLESYFAAERAHLAHSLGATMIPALDELDGMIALGRAIGQDLNFYSAFNSRIAPSWIGNRDRRERGERLVEPLPLFSFDRDVPIEEFLQDTKLSSTRRKGRAFMSRIAQLPAEMRADEIRRLKTGLRAKARSEDTSLISFDNADTFTAIASILFGFLYPPIAGVRNVGRQIANIARRIPAVDKMLDTINADTVEMRGGNEDLDFLSRIDRVASLRQQD